MRFMEQSEIDRINAEFYGDISNMSPQDCERILKEIDSFCENCGCMDFIDSDIWFRKTQFGNVVYHRYNKCENCGCKHDLIEVRTEMEHIEKTCRKNR